MDRCGELGVPAQELGRITKPVNIRLEPAVKACSRKFECRRKHCLQTAKPYLYAPPTSVRALAIMPPRVKAPDCRKLV